MKILILSLPDLLKISPQRPHFLIHHLAMKHEITLYCEGIGEGEEDVLSARLLDGVDIRYYRNDGRNQILQEIFSPLYLMNLNLKQYDICLSFNSLISLMYLSKQTKNPSLPLIIDICDDLPEIFSESTRMPKFVKPFSKFAISLVQRILAHRVNGISYVTEGIASKYDLPLEKSIQIPNGIDLEHFGRSLTMVNEEQEKEYISVGFVGFIGTWVDFFPLFNSIKQLNEQKDHSYHLFIAGAGDKLGHQKQAAHDLGIDRYTSFLGSIQYDDVPSFISDMQVCVIPFDSTNISNNALPIKLFEYLFLKKPVISTPLEGVKNAVGDIVQYASTSDEYTAILEKYKDKIINEELVEKGHDLVKNNYSWNSLSMKFESFIESHIRC